MKILADAKKIKKRSSISQNRLKDLTISRIIIFSIHRTFSIYGAFSICRNET